MHRRLVQQQQGREAARLGDQRRVAQDHADQQRLLLAGAGQRGRRCRCGVGQRHVGAVRAQRRGAGGGVARAVGREAGAQPVLHRQRGLGRQPVGDRADQADPAGGNAPTAPPRKCRVQACHQGHARGGGGDGVARHGVLQPGEPGRGPDRALAPAGGCGCPWRRRARRSRGRGRVPAPRPAGRGSGGGRTAPSWNSRSICGVSQTAATRAAISAWLRGAAPSRRKTRRSRWRPSGGVPVPMSHGSPCAVANRPATRPAAGGRRRRARSAIRAPRRPRPGTSSETASSRLVLPLPFGPNSTAMRRARPPGQRRVAAEVGQRQAQQLHDGSKCGRGARSVNGGRVRSASWWSKMHGRRPWPATNLFTRGGPFHSWRACSLVAGCADVSPPIPAQTGRCAAGDRAGRSARRPVRNSGGAMAKW